MARLKQPPSPHLRVKCPGRSISGQLMTEPAVNSPSQSKTSICLCSFNMVQ